MWSVAKGCILTATCSHETAWGANCFCCCEHGSNVIVRELFDSYFCHLLMVGVNIIPAESLTPTAAYAGSRAEQHLEGSVSQNQYTKRISGQPCILVAMIPFQGFGGFVSTQHHGARVCCRSIWECRSAQRLFTFFFFALSSTSALLLLIPLFIPFTPPPLFLPPPQQSGSLMTAVQDRPACLPSGSLVRVWSVDSRGRDRWDQVNRERERWRQRGRLWEWDRRENPERSRQTALTAADLFDWLYLMAEICNKMDVVGHWKVFMVQQSEAAQLAVS